MTVNLWGCGGSAPAEIPPEALSGGRNSIGTASKQTPASTKVSGNVSEVSPPEVIGQLKEVLDQYQPQLAIVSPGSNEVLNDNTVSVKFQLKDLPLFKDEKLGLGPHIHLFLDDQPYQAVYDASKPVVLSDLAPGTHTIRAFASRPWHESFKNEGAYAQTTFHVFTKTPNNNPSTEQPLLTYSRPQGSYGAEPIMLDFYLTNAPLHFVAQEDQKDEVVDWRIKATVNGSSFILDRWQPIYLKGFEPGKNWVQLEYIDENGNLIQNVYNNTARIITYESGSNDTLSKLVRGELSFDAARSIVDPNYTPSQSTPETVPTTPKPSPTLEAKPVPTVAPVVPLPQVRDKTPLVPVVPLPETTDKLPTAQPDEEESPAIAPSPSSPKSTHPKGGFFNRFRPGAEKPTPAIPVPIPSEAPVTSDVPQLETKPDSAPEIPAVIKAKEPDSKKLEVKAPDELPADKSPDVKASEPEILPAKETPKRGFFNRFRPGAKSAPPAPPKPTPTEAIETVPDVESSEAQDSVVERYDAERRDAEKELEKAPALEAPDISKPMVPPVKETPKGGFFDRFRPGAKSAPAPTRPEPSIKATETVEPTKAEKPSDSKDSVVERYDDRKVKALEEVPVKSSKPAELPKATAPLNAIEKALPKPAATQAPVSAPAPSKSPSLEDLDATETTLPEPAAPAAKPTPKPRGFFDRFRPTNTKAPNVAPTPSLEAPTSPSPTPSPQDPLQILEKKEAADNKPNQPNANGQSRDSLVERLLRSPEPTQPAIDKPSLDLAPNKPSETASPKASPTLSSPKAEKTPLPNIRPTAKPPAIDRQPSKQAPTPVKPEAKPPQAEPTVETPVAPTEVEAPNGSGFQPQTELERRLGIPLKAMSPSAP